MKEYNGNNNYYPKKIGKIYYDDYSDVNWENYRNSILETRSKSQDDFEKYINLISSGGFILALTFLDKLVERNIEFTLRSLLLISIACFVTSLVANLFSHLKSIKNDDKTIEEIDLRDENISENIDKRNRAIEILNKISLWCISIGIILLFTFFIYNFFSMSNDKKNQDQKPKTTTQGNPKTLNEEKGRTSQKPSFEVKPKK